VPTRRNTPPIKVAFVENDLARHARVRVDADAHHELTGSCFVNNRVPGNRRARRWDGQSRRQVGRKFHGRRGWFAEKPAGGRGGRDDSRSGWWSKRVGQATGTCRSLILGLLGGGFIGRHSEPRVIIGTGSI